MRRLIFALALLLSSFASQAAGPPTDYSGIYYNRMQSGYGYNFVQTGSFVFVTAYVYADLTVTMTGVPVWFIATLTWNGVDAFEGEAYLTRGGTDFFSPWVPGSVQESFFGHAKFTPSAGNHYAGTFVTDTQPGVPAVTHVLERQPLTDIDLRGTYIGTEYVSRNCGDGPSPLVPRAGDLSVAVPAGGPATFTFKTSKTSADCVLVGALEQHGQIHVMPSGTYSCGAATASAQSPEIRRTPQGLEGRFVFTPGNGCTYDARFSATAAPPGASVVP